MPLDRRRLLGLAAAAAVVPRFASAQPRPARLVGAMIGAGGPTDPSGIEWEAAIRAGLAEEGWSEGINFHVEPRFTAGNPELSLAFATELLALSPDAMIAGTQQNAVNVHTLTPAMPLVFVAVEDPIGAGLIQSIARPGGNVTGVMQHGDSMGGKWVSLLLEVAPQLARIGFIYSPGRRTERFLPPFREACAVAGVQPVELFVSTVDEIEPAVVALASQPFSGLVVPSNNWLFSNRSYLLGAVDRCRMPTIWSSVGFAVDGGLITYAPDTTEAFRRAGIYAGRILSGVSPADLPVQSAPRHLLIVNLRTASAQGIAIPPTLLAIADRVIE